VTGHNWFEREGDPPSVLEDTEEDLRIFERFKPQLEPPVDSLLGDIPIEAVDQVESRSLASAGDREGDAEGEGEDISGVWVRVKAVNFDSYVGAQGAGYLQRKMAAAVSITHIITLDPHLSAVRIQVQPYMSSTAVFMLH
jgi:hypothetical protein